MKFLRLALFGIAVFLITSCGKEENTNALFTRLSPGTTNIDFGNILQEDHDFNVLRYQYIYNGGGVAAGDLNNDGLPELFFTGNFVKNKLYANKGNMEFEDISDALGLDDIEGWNSGVTMADVNGDGLLDIYICRNDIRAKPEGRANLLFINQGDLKFKEMAKEYGINDMGYSNQAAFFDMDLDGDLDMYLIQHSTKFKTR